MEYSLYYCLFFVPCVPSEENGKSRIGGEVTGTGEIPQIQAPHRMERKLPKIAQVPFFFTVWDLR